MPTTLWLNVTDKSKLPLFVTAEKKGISNSQSFPNLPFAALEFVYAKTVDELSIVLFTMLNVAELTGISPKSISALYKSIDCTPPTIVAESIVDFDPLGFNVTNVAIRF